MQEVIRAVSDVLRHNDVDVRAQCIVKQVREQLCSRQLNENGFRLWQANVNANATMCSCSLVCLLFLQRKLSFIEMRKDEGLRNPSTCQVAQIQYDFYTHL